MLYDRKKIEKYYHVFLFIPYKKPPAEIKLAQNFGLFEKQLDQKLGPNYKSYPPRGFFFILS